VRTLDANVIMRLLVGDAPQQTPIAERAFLAAVPSGGVYLPDVVLAEVAWVLRGGSAWSAPVVWWWMTLTW